MIAARESFPWDRPLRILIETPLGLKLREENGSGTTKPLARCLLPSAILKSHRRPVDASIHPLAVVPEPVFQLTMHRGFPLTGDKPSTLPYIKLTAVWQKEGGLP